MIRQCRHPAPLPPRAATRRTPHAITHGNDVITAKTISGNRREQKFDMLGAVVLALPRGQYTGDAAHFNVLTRTGVIDNAKGRSLSPNRRALLLFPGRAVSAGAEKRAASALQRHHHLNHEAHPHYRLLAKDFYLYPDNSYRAHALTLEVAGHPLFTLPDMTGKLGTRQSTQPFLGFGHTTIDGTYLSVAHDFQITNDTDLDSRPAQGRKTSSAAMPSSIVSCPFRRRCRGRSSP